LRAGANLVSSTRSWPRSFDEDRSGRLNGQMVIARRAVPDQNEHSTKSSAEIVPLLRSRGFLLTSALVAGFNDKKEGVARNLGSRTGRPTVVILDHRGFWPM
jgi:hypothetical protein